MSTIGPPGQRLSYDQIEKLWTDNGGNPLAAPIMAAIALAESGGLVNNLNDNPSTGDYSVGLWQINYFQGLGPARTAQYGSPTQLASDPNRQAAAAVSISGNGTNLRPWSTYTSGAASRILTQHGGSIGPIPQVAPTGNAAAVGSPNMGSVDGEGTLFDFSQVQVLGKTVIPGLSLHRATVRKLGGVLVFIGGAWLAVQAVTGQKQVQVAVAAAKGAVGVQGGPTRQVSRRAVAARERVRQEGITQRADMRAQRKRQAESESVAGLGDTSGGDL